jgi:uncharacterized protein YcbK (DUF882 family)
VIPLLVLVSAVLCVAAFTRPAAPGPAYSVGALTVTSRPELQDTPSAAVVRELARLSAALEVASRPWGRRFTVTSGYRSELLNAALDGAPGSNHKFGRAADVDAPSGDPVSDASAMGRALDAAGVPWDELIAYPSRGHVHLAIPAMGATARRYTATK